MTTAIFAAVFAAYYTNVLGRDFLPILATSSVLLTVVGLALRELILDAVSGISLSVEQSLKVGHWILLRTKEQTLHGVIEVMGWRNVRMRSRDDQIHFVPNSLIFQTILTNFSMMKGYTRVEIPFEVSSRADLSSRGQFLRRPVDPGPAKGQRNAAGARCHARPQNLSERARLI